MRYKFHFLSLVFLIFSLYSYSQIFTANTLSLSGYLTSKAAPEGNSKASFSLAPFAYSGTGTPYPGDYDRDGDIDILASNATGTTFFRNDLSTGGGFTDINIGIPYTYDGDYPFALGDYDNDGDIDIAHSLRGPAPDYGFITAIYRNDNGTFVEISNDMQGIWMGKIAWGDYDNDGDLDLFLYGNHEQSDDGEPLGLLYRNDGNDVFTNTEIYIEDARRGALALADYNNDGFLDILTCGYNLSQNIFTSILKNNEGYSFTNIDAGIQGYSYGDIDWGDYDNDGYLDIFITGGLYGGGGISQIFHNNGDNTFSDIGTTFPGKTSYRQTAEWGDYDNDGDLDILYSNENCIIQNEGNNNFVPVDIGVNVDAGRWADIDNDGDLDILTESGIYINNSSILNGEPDIPKLLNSAISGSQALLSWKMANDAITPSEGISYNVCVGTSPGNWDILSPMTASGPNYSKAIPGMGNAFTNTFKIIRDLPTGTYYWTVQSVDNGFMTSDFAPVESFEILAMFTNTFPASWSDNSIYIRWGDYDNDGAPDFLYSHYSTINLYHNDGNDSFTPVDPGIYGSYQNLDWIDYDNDGDLDLITTDSIYRNDPGNVFTNAGIYFEFINYSYVTGDYDADGDIDILSDNEYIYRNNGDNTFTPIPIELTDQGIGSFDWFDYDNDGDLDLIIVHGTYLLYITEIFRNDGDDNFTGINANLVGLDWGSISYADFDNDNDLDLYLGGVDSNNNYHTKLIRNNGADSFTEVITNIRGYNQPNSFWGDYNNDGNSDLVISGWNNGRTRNKLYLNNQDDSFTELDIENIIEYIKIFDCADYDNDGDMDALTNRGVFRNNTNHSNDIPPVLTNLNSDLQGLDSRLYWDRANDPKEPGYSYNIKIGRTPGGTDIKSPVSSPGLGNVPTDTSWVIQDLSPGLYYWSVQAINLNHIAGPWAPVESFLITDVSPDFTCDTVCFGESTSFRDLSVTTDVIIAWNWAFGDGSSSTEEDPVHRYMSADTFAVSLKVFSQSGDSAQRVRPVIVRPTPDALFSVQPVCKDYPSILVNQSNVDNIVIDSWQWDFGNGEFSNVQNSVQKIYVNSDTAILTIIATNGCWDADTQIVAIAEYPDASLSLLPGYSNNFCDGDSTIIIAPYNSSYYYQWQLNGANIFNASDTSLLIKGPGGKYSVDIENPVAGCASSDSIQITINQAPSSPNIMADGPVQFCEGDSVTLLVSDNPDYTFQWKLNGGAVGSNSNEYIAMFQGNITLDITNPGGCSVSSNDSIDILVNPAPEIKAVNFSGPTEFCQGGNLIMSVTEIADHNYQWRNEYGIIAGETSGTYQTNETGIYILDIENLNGCVVQTIPVNVKVKPIPVSPVLQYDNYVPGECLGTDPVKLYPDYTQAGLAYQWLRNGMPIAFATNDYLEGFLSEGDYSLSVDLNACIAESNILTLEFEDAPEKPDLFVKGPVVWYMAASNDTAAQYKWYHNNDLIQDANNYLYVANKQLGTYKVAIGNDKGCFTMSDEISIPTTKSQMTDFFVPEELRVDEDIDPFASLKIYPNPTPGVFTVEMDNSIMGELDIRIFSSEGRQILNIKFNKTTNHFQSHIDIGGQGDGIYLINFLLDKYFANRKIVVE